MVTYFHYCNKFLRIGGFELTFSSSFEQLVYFNGCSEGLDDFLQVLSYFLKYFVFINGS